MRTHFLSKLEISGREQGLDVFPDFDFYALTRVRDLRFFVDTEGDTTLTILADYEAEFQKKVGDVLLRFERIRLAKFPEMTPYLFLSEMDIEDVSGSQLEGINYRIQSYGEWNLEILAGGIAIVNCSKL